MPWTAAMTAVRNDVPVVESLGTRGSLRAIRQRRLDRLDQDIRAVIGSSAVDAFGVAWKGCSILLVKCRRTGILTYPPLLPYHRPDRPLWAEWSWQTCQSQCHRRQQRGDCQSRYLLHLLSNQDTTS